MDISALSITDLPSNPRLLAKDQGAAPAVPAASETPDPAKLAEAAARLHPEKAESLAAQLKSSIALYNANNSPAIAETMDQYRVRFGDEMADRAGQTMGLLRADAGRLIEAQDQALKAQFTVAGQTYSYDKDTDSYTPARYSATLEAPDYAVRFGSETGAQISVLGQPFTGQFPRSGRQGPAPLLDITA